MKRFTRAVALFAGLILLPGTTAAGCLEHSGDDAPAAENAVHDAAIDLGHDDKVTLSGHTLEGIRSHVGGSASADELAGEEGESQVHTTLERITEHLDADTANDIIEAACQVEGLSPDSPPSPPPLLPEVGAEKALKTAAEGDPSEQFAARAICAAAADFDALKRAGG